jgi:4'-phosphopantetheinyl transferase EntD
VTLPLLARLLPPTVACCEERGAPTGELLLEEAALLAGNCTASRFREFAAGRQTARKALAKLTSGRHPILRGKNKEPIWPTGFCGSITHCDHYCAAATASVANCAAIGIDAEPHVPLPADVMPLIATRGEQHWFSNNADGVLHWDTLLFSIKESVYKAWYPLVRCWLDFDRAHVRIDMKGGSFEVEIDHPNAHILSGGQALHGRFLMTSSLVLSAVVVPSRTPQS